MAAEFGLTPEQFQAEAEEVAQVQGSHDRDINAATDHALARTGLTPQKINQWEDEGGDYSTFAGFDSVAGDIAANYPQLGPGDHQGLHQPVDRLVYSGHVPGAGQPAAG